MYGIWCKDRDDWMRDRNHVAGIVAFVSKRAAQKAAAVEYGKRSYSEAKRQDWCEVRPIEEKKS